MEEDRNKKNKQGPKRAISETRAQNGNYIGMKLLGCQIGTIFI
jgi:hypothetical protein